MKRLRSLFGHMLFILYLGVLLRLTVFRANAFSGPLFSGKTNLAPFIAYRQLLSWGSYYHAAYLFFGNIAWFMPLGLYLRKQKWRFFPCLLCGLLLSLFIESMQYILGSGISETDDLILNTFGAILGYMAGAF